ncbi:response regulator [Senegalimassilia faecalis]|uniref:histidine kinase n=1 Tax=Senegalimassilia faecalis TaxID=2509433 RepID=A0A4Q2JW86_9ACTN|nr:ATP-binding protein [Senegalimassilia faecalis]RXZ53249.1 response regulator [Senegalimassilia faecalis]
MNKKQTMNPDTLRAWDTSVRRAVVAGLALIAIAFAVACMARIGVVSSLAGDVTATLQQQCGSYEKLMAADRTKSLFHLTYEMQQFSSYLASNPDSVNDAFLEQQVGDLNLTGISVIGGDMQLQASGYTRQFRDTSWAETSLGSLVADIVDYPEKVYADRVQVDGAFYDVCAVARKDAPGLIVGFYEQPSGLITGTEDDLESLLSGLQLEDGGNYAIAEDGHVRASSNDALRDLDVADDTLLSGISAAPNDAHLHPVRMDMGMGWGYRSEAASYELYVYYPMSAIYVVALIVAGIVAVAYLLLCLVFFFVRARALYRNQEKLEDANRDLTHTVEMLKSLESVYFTLFRVDLAESRYQTIYLAPWLEDAVSQEGEYTELKKLFLGTMVLPEYRRVLDKRMSAQFIRENLSKRNTSAVRKSFYTDYVATHGGANRWCRVTVTVVDYDAEGQPARVLALLQDVDQEKKREADYQERILEEARAAKIANNAKSEFLRRISHDVRTPINGAKGYVQLAAAHPQDAALQQHCREQALVSLDTLTSLVDSVLDMAKLEGSEVALEHRCLDLNDVLNKVKAVIQPQADAKGITCRIAHVDDAYCAYLLGSPRHVGQVLMNLVGNAVKYGKPKGSVQLSIQFKGASQGKATYEFSCSDDGIGMGEEFQQHMFEPFAQEAPGARTVYEGSGTGLSIVKKLVEAMGGTISWTSAKGQGTTFRVTLSFAIDTACRIDRSDVGNVPDSLRGANVLLVEDNEMNMEIAECLLVDLGARVTRAWDGQEAVDIFAASSTGAFDIVFMDIMMPRKNGLEATRAIRALDHPDAKTVPICAMSANAFHDDVQASLDAGMNAHFAKPIDVAKLLPAIAKLVGFHG